MATGTREAGRGLKAELRRQVASAGLGQRLANSWRDKHYPNQQLDASSLVYTKAANHPRIRRRRGHHELTLSRDPDRESAGKGPDGKRISPSTFRSTASVRSDSRPDRRERRCWWWTACAPHSAGKPESCEASGARPTALAAGSGLTTVVMFLLVPQLKLSKPAVSVFLQGRTQMCLDRADLCFKMHFSIRTLHRALLNI